MIKRVKEVLSYVIAHHLLTDTRTALPEPRLDVFLGTLPQFICWARVLYCEISSWSLPATCPS